jgi:hypothetical protein
LYTGQEMSSTVMLLGAEEEDEEVEVVLVTDVDPPGLGVSVEVEEVDEEDTDFRAGYSNAATTITMITMTTTARVATRLTAYLCWNLTNFEVEDLLNLT